MVENIETLLEEAQMTGLHIEPELIPYFEKAMNLSGKERRDKIESAFKQSRIFRQYYKYYIEGSEKRFLTKSNVCYVDAGIMIKNFTTPEIDEIIISGVAACYLQHALR